VLPGSLDQVNLDGERCPGNKQAERRKWGSCAAAVQGGFCELGGSLEVAISTSLQNRRLHAGDRPPVIGGTLLVGIMNSVVSAEVIGRALLQ